MLFRRWQKYSSSTTVHTSETLRAWLRPPPGRSRHELLQFSSRRQVRQPVGPLELIGSWSTAAAVANPACTQSYNNDLLLLRRGLLLLDPLDFDFAVFHQRGNSCHRGKDRCEDGSDDTDGQRKFRDGVVSVFDD